MAYLLRTVERVRDVPSFYPPINDADPGAYPVRTVQMRMFIRAMLRAGCLEDRPIAPDEAIRGRMSSLVLWTADGRVVSPAQCNEVARGMRVAYLKGVPDDLAAELRADWDGFQQHMLRETQARDEVAIAGFEAFPYNASSLRNDLVHFGAYHAMATELGGYVVNPVS